MRYQAIVAALTVAASIVFLPLLNLLGSTEVGEFGLSNLTRFYKVDKVLGIANWALISLGISSDPKQVIVGRDGWLFLGDAYAATVSDDRRTEDANDRKFAEKVYQATMSWQAYLSKHGVRSYRIVVGPNKNRIYGEHAPEWMRVDTRSVTDSFLEKAGPHYVLAKDEIVSAKDEYDAPLYYKTDTHWTSLGAAVAFQKLLSTLSGDLPELRMPNSSWFNYSKSAARNGGDLASFLFVNSHVEDLEPITEFDGTTLSTTHIDWKTGKLLYEGKSKAIDNTNTPIVAHTDGALNQKRVLWLRDSFGTAMSPLVSATFSDVMQVHWDVALRRGELPGLVEQWQPEIILVTVVERSARHEFFSYMPPMSAPSVALQFLKEFGTVLVGGNHVRANKIPWVFHIAGDDPQAVFAVPTLTRKSDTTHVLISLKCIGSEANPRLKLYWSTIEKREFSENRSVNFVYNSEDPVLDLKQLGMLDEMDKISRLRIDIEDQSTCTTFRLLPPIFGHL